MLLVLSLPAFLGVLSLPELNEIVYLQAVRMTFFSVFPIALIMSGFSSIVGGYFGEKFS